MDKSQKSHLTRDLKRTARALGIPEGAAEQFITAALPAIEKSLKGKSIITESDLSRLLARELKKYHTDFAYVHKIRDIII